MDVSYEKLESDYLVPLFQRLINTCHRISPGKKCLYQPILVNDPDRKIYHPPFISMKTPVKGDNVFYAPHIYEGDSEKLKDWIRQYEKDAQVSGKPIFFGEWGNATNDRADSTLTGQQEYRDIYMKTANLFDSLQVGTIKAWFTGTRFLIRNPNGIYTWALYKDKSGQGSIERKYIMDIIARPYPQCIAGDILDFRVDFPTRTLAVDLLPDNSKGASRIFIPANRWYPDGFTITAGELVVKYDPLKNTGLEVVRPGRGGSGAELVWDPFRQQLVVLSWPQDKIMTRVLIQPGLIQELIPR